MRVLMAATACSPYRVSEHSVGWVWMRVAAEHHDVHLICSDYDKPELDRAAQEGLLPDNVTITPVGQPVWPYSKDRFTARLQTWRRASQFQHALGLIVPGIVHREQFDLCHHTSIATWRLGSPLVHSGLPLVWGPLGGGERLPLAYLTTLTKKAWVLELGRLVSNAKDRWRPLVRQTAHQAAVAISTNHDTDKILKSLGCRCRMIRCPMLLENSKFRTIHELGSSRVRNPGLLRIFSGGTLEARKGIGMSLRALTQLKQCNIPFHYTFGNHGPDLPTYKTMAARLGLEHHVTFLPALAGDDYLRRLSESDVFLLPSLRDNTSLTLIEAMAAGCMPIVLKTGGPGDAVTDECGVAMPVATPGRTVSAIAGALRLAWEKPKLAEQFGAAARERVRKHYLADQIPAVIQEAYQHVMECRNKERGF
jgi:glycosyltransferase involved in cell wall biosynthesis